MCGRVPPLHVFDLGFFFRYSSIALLISALTGTSVFLDRALSFFACVSLSQMFVRFILPMYIYQQLLPRRMRRNVEQAMIHVDALANLLYTSFLYSHRMYRRCVLLL